MPTAVLDLSLDALPTCLDHLEAHTRARLLLRWGGAPVGEVELPVVGGRLSGQELREVIVNALSPELLRRWHEVETGAAERKASHALPSLTVAICTRNRPQDLARCLDACKKLPDLGQEILVVDNCPSTDATRRLVARYPHVRYIREEQKGLNRARNRALREARGEVVAFTDDDAAPDPRWLEALARNFDHPLVMCVTGLTWPLELETQAQEQFEVISPFGRGYARRTFDWEFSSVVAVGPVGAGVNMALRRTVLDVVGPFDPALDAGTPTQSGGDTEMFIRILAAGYRIVYEPDALARHRHRRTWQELRGTLYGYGVGVYAAWTCRLVRGREWTVFALAWQWLSKQQLPNLARALLRRPGHLPLDLVWAELCGCAVGPWAYFAARRAAKYGE